MGEPLEGIPGLFVLPAVNTYETSNADVYMTTTFVYASATLSCVRCAELSMLKPDVGIYKLYKELSKTTTGSHVTIYNNAEHGSIYTETTKDYSPRYDV